MTSALLLNKQSSELNSYFSLESSNSQLTSSTSQSSSNSAISAICKGAQQFTNIISSQPNSVVLDPPKLDDPKDISTSLNGKNLVKNLRNIITTSLGKDDTQTSPVEIPVHHSPQATSSGCQSSQFIDPTELKTKLFEFSSKFLLILLDCRTYNDFNLKHIKDSVHLNCRDKLTRKRLQTRKLTVKDLISSEEIKNKLDQETDSPPNSVVGSLVTAAKTQADFATSLLQPADNDKPDNNMIVLYDDTTSELSDLQSDQNPLKIVQENIKQSGYNKDCKILKGGFKSFFEVCPEFCILKDLEETQRNFFNKHKEYFLEMREDQRQSAIDNTTMTEITPYLFLGNESDAKNCELLEKKGIFYILNVTKNIPFYDSTNTINNQSEAPVNGRFCFKRIAVNDCENQNLKNHFNEASDFIDLAKLKNQKVLVHCQAGISRSPTIVLAYLMSRFNLAMNDAYNQVKLQRPIIGPNLIFMSQLQDYESKLNNLDKRTPIEVIHTQQPESSPVQVTTQLEVKYLSNSLKENSENNSPDAVANETTSYFKVNQVTANNSSNKNNKCTNLGDNNSILVSN